MTQEITTSTTFEDVKDLVSGFVVEDADGTLRLNDTAMHRWLLNQYRYMNGSASSSSPVAKGMDAQSIVTNLRNAIDKKNFVNHPNWPGAVTSVNETVRQRLIAIKDKLSLEVMALEQPYKDFRAGLLARLKTLFNTVIAPSFPEGKPITETTQLYVETFVTDWGEESQPSLPSELVTMDENDTVSVTCSAPPAGRNITHRRLYRSATGTNASAFRLQGEYPIATTVIVDDKKASELNDICPTFGWLEPPADLQGLVGMANGMMVGFVDRTLYACEPYHPYAWPAKYDKPLSSQIVGMVSMGQSVFVGTKGRPYLLSGSDANSLSEELISSKVRCMSAQSMVAIRNSVFYASEGGIALYEGGTVTVVTEGLIDRKKWAEYNPETMRAAEYDGQYFLFYTRDDDSQGCIVFDYKNRTLSELDQAADCVFADNTGLYGVIDDEFVNLLPPAGANRVGKWYSKTFRMNGPKSIGWIQVDSDFKNGDDDVTVTVRVYGDGALIYTVEVENGAPVRHPPGHYSDWRVEIESAAVINSVVLATKTEELKAIP